MPFWPDSFWGLAWLYALIAAAVPSAIFGGSDGRRIAGVLCLNWIGTRALVAWGPGYETALMGALDFASLAALLYFVRSRLGQSVAAMYACMIAVYILHVGRVIDVVAMHEIIEILGVIQLLLMVGTIYHGNGGRSRYRADAWRNRNAGLGASVDVRMASPVSDRRSGQGVQRNSSLD